MNIIIRPECMKEHVITENLAREAFYNVHGPGCDEHYLLHMLHASDELIPELNLVAEAAGQLVGQVICTRARIVGKTQVWSDVLCLGPIDVLPAMQRQGIGGQLIQAVAQQARALGFRAILLYGDPKYYGKKGFIPAATYGICTPDDMYADALQAMELAPGTLDGVKGRFFEDPVFAIDAQAAAAFEAKFPAKEKRMGLPSQRNFLDIASRRRPVR